MYGCTLTQNVDVFDKPGGRKIGIAKPGPITGDAPVEDWVKLNLRVGGLFPVYTKRHLLPTSYKLIEPTTPPDPKPDPDPIQHPDLWELTVGQDYNPPTPAVVILKSDPHAFFDKQWQFFVRAINMGKSLHHVTALYGDNLAFFNRTGFPGKRNYLTGEGVGKPDPNADKVRSCLRNVVTGTQYGSNVDILTFDSRKPPPLKYGCAYPDRVEDIDLNDYLVTPQTAPWMFVVANIINDHGDLVPFPNGAIYPWTKDNLPYSFLPLISNHGYGPVIYPASKMRRLAPDEPIPSPYRRT